MFRRTSTALPWLLLLSLGACGDDATPNTDAGAALDAAIADAGAMQPDATSDSGPALDGGFDAGPEDAGPEDAGPEDAGAPDAGPMFPLPGFGTISGSCGTLAAEIPLATPGYIVTSIDFGDDPFDNPEDLGALTSDAQEVLTEGTVGGSSEVSEAFAMEVLARCEGATLLLSESEVRYDPPSSKKTDLVVSLAEERVGVSVVRAFRFPLGTEYPLADGQRVIGRKLRDILESSANVVPEDGWTKQVLAVLAYADQAEDVVEMVRDMSDAGDLADTVIYVIVTDGMDDPIY